MLWQVNGPTLRKWSDPGDQGYGALTLRIVATHGPFGIGSFRHHARRIRRAVTILSFLLWSACSDPRTASPSMDPDLDRAAQWLRERVGPSGQWIPFGDGPWPEFGAAAAAKMLAFDDPGEHDPELRALLRGLDLNGVRGAQDSASRHLIDLARSRRDPPRSESGPPATSDHSPKHHAFWPQPQSSLGQASVAILEHQGAISGDSLDRLLPPYLRALNALADDSGWIGLELVMAGHAYQRVAHSAALEPKLLAAVSRSLRAQQRYDGSWRVPGEDRAWSTLCAYTALRLWGTR